MLRPTVGDYFEDPFPVTDEKNWWSASYRDAGTKGPGPRHHPVGGSPFHPEVSYYYNVADDEERCISVICGRP